MTGWHDILPNYELGSKIPRIIHQTYPSAFDNLPGALRDNVEYLKRMNPKWEHRFYSNSDVESFILDEYGQEVLNSYCKIRPEYGPARADLFRYLLIYRAGGVYLDMKSRFDRPIESVISGDEMFILSQWRNGPGEPHCNFGLHAELAHVAGGEFQQWHVIAAPGHPFLRAVILRVLENIDTYRPWKQGVGKMGVLRTTGPIPFTLAIASTDAPHTRIADEAEIGLLFSIEDGYDHQKAFRRHYSNLDTYVVSPPLMARPAAWAFRAAKRLRDWARPR